MFYSSTLDFKSEKEIDIPCTIYEEEQLKNIPFFMKFVFCVSSLTQIVWQETDVLIKLYLLVQKI